MVYKKGGNQKVWKQHRVSLAPRYVVRTRPLYSPTNHVWVHAQQIKFVSLGEMERMRRYLRRIVGKKGTVWSRERTEIPLHKKSKGARMGKGIGSSAGRCLLVRRGEWIFEVRGLYTDMQCLYNPLVQCLKKFSFKCTLVVGGAISEIKKGGKT